MSKSSRQDRLTRHERFVAGAIGLACLAGVIWLTWFPPARSVAIEGCTPSPQIECTTDIDGDVTALATVVLALAGIAALVAVLGVRFTSVKVAGVEVDAREKLEEKTKGLEPVFADGSTGSNGDVAEARTIGTEAYDASARVAGLPTRIADLDAATRAEHRQAIYKAHRGLFLSHLLAPATSRGQRFEVFLFLVRHKGHLDRSEIRSTTFYFGPHWGSRVFRGEWTDDGQLGVVTEAHGEFLAICEVEFSDGSRVVLDHYVDFSMADLLA